GDLPRQGPRIHDGVSASETIANLPSVSGVLLVRVADAKIDRESGAPMDASFQGVDVRTAAGLTSTARPPWTILRGRDAAGPDEVVISESIASGSHLAPGASLTLRASCVSEREALPPTRVRIAGIAEFPFAAATEDTLGGSFAALKNACAGNVGDEVDVL